MFNVLCRDRVFHFGRGQAVCKLDGLLDLIISQLSRRDAVVIMHLVSAILKIAVKYWLVLHFVASFLRW